MKQLNTLKQPATSYADKLLDSLRSQGVLDTEQQEVAERLQKKNQGQPIAQTLIDIGISEESVQKAVADLFGMLFIHITSDTIDFEFVKTVGSGWCREHGIVPVCIDGKRYLAAQSPDAVFLAEDICSEQCANMGHAIALRRDLENAVDLFDSQTQKIQPEVQEEECGEGSELSLDLESASSEADSSPVVSFVSNMIATALRENASDIHFEPSDGRSQVRYRIDGVLHDLDDAPKRLHAAVVSRIKILANLDIAERRLPQDGRIRAMILGRSLDLRVSTVPTPKGEKIVMRLLDDRNIRVGLDELGFRKEVLHAWQKEIVAPNGIILVTGPTGCGKTTTLYSSLQSMDRKRLNISTVEDPVEYELDGITQIQVHDKIDMTFSRALRALLRQDPDVVLLGEIRDKETAGVAIQAAMTGHLVLSTLHTNDAPSSMTRLINIGVEPFLVASAVNAVLAQRLARRVCKHCVEFKAPTSEEIELLNGFTPEKIPHAIGCSKCRDSGYNGRLGVYELLLMNDELRDLIASNPTITTFRNKCLETGMQNLRIDGFAKIAEGLTTLEEVLRLT
ncbi:MAG: type II/IV secretion system protein [Phycisphaerae bacterium]|jgi:type IV pilus assembly protein PilB|nr:type II/IV secretion system protein [Phycisphaerae bacterium]HJN72125.1 GspE/PulE family protein [Phycisphaerales bacterium]|tara:strand:- start:4567 stop:6261 length:1695 start_codon:yes stop_codon:yes gene_type:complete